MQIRDDEETLAGQRIVAKKSVKPVAAGLFAGQPTESFVVAVGRIEREEFAVTKCWFADEIDEAAVKVPQLFLLGRKAGAVVVVIVHPFYELRHRPVIEDAGAGVVVAETFRAGTRLADFLAVVKHDRAARHSVENRG